MNSPLQKRLKALLLTLISLAFTVSGIFLANKISWFPVLFFGGCTLVFVYMLFNPQKENSYDDEIFLSLHDSGTIDYHDWGFYDPNNDCKFYWDKIHMITAFRKDLITYDDVYLSIEHEFDVFNISESYPGWLRFKEEISNRYSLTDPKWFEKVVNPNFNDEIILYKKQMVN